MSWVRASDIGAAADISDVRAVADVFANEGIVFYNDEHDWFVNKVACQQYDRDKAIIHATIPVISLTSVKMVNPDWTEVDVTVDSINGKLIYIDFGDNIFTGYFKFSGAIGWARMSETTVGDDLLIGDTIIRNGASMLIDANQSAIAGDILLSPPAILRKAGTGIGRMIFNLELDDEVDDDEKIEEHDKILARWHFAIQPYK